MGSQMLTNELMVGAERALVDAAATRGWRVAQVDGARRRPRTGAWVRWQMGALAIRVGALLLGASGRAQISSANRSRTPMRTA